MVRPSIGRCARLSVDKGRGIPTCYGEPRNLEWNDSDPSGIYHQQSEGTNRRTLHIYDKNFFTICNIKCKKEENFTKTFFFEKRKQIEINIFFQ